jgi:hypothetical protein
MKNSHEDPPLAQLNNRTWRGQFPSCSVIETSWVNIKSKDLANSIKTDKHPKSKDCGKTGKRLELLIVDFVYKQVSKKTQPRL